MAAPYRYLALVVARSFFVKELHLKISLSRHLLFMGTTSLFFSDKLKKKDFR